MPEHFNFRINIRLGEWDTSKQFDCDTQVCSDPVVNVPIAGLIPHEQYNPRSPSQENDIALIRLSRSVTFSNWIRPICLPIGTQNENYLNEGLQVVGWGRTSQRNGRSILKLSVSSEWPWLCLFLQHRWVPSNRKWRWTAYRLIAATKSIDRIA